MLLCKAELCEFHYNHRVTSLKEPFCLSLVTHTNSHQFSLLLSNLQQLQFLCPKTQIFPQCPPNPTLSAHKQNNLYNLYIAAKASPTTPKQAFLSVAAASLCPLIGVAGLQDKEPPSLTPTRVIGNSIHNNSQWNMMESVCLSPTSCSGTSSWATTTKVGKSIQKTIPFSQIKT